MNINYEYYKIFYYVAKYKSFTKAANVLYSNQPNISRTILKLEKELNCKLFLRSKNGLTLTPEGEKLYAHVKVAQEQLMQAEDELSKQEKLEFGSISIGVTETALNIYLLDKLEIFHNKYPNIHLRISNHSTPQALDALDHGNVDIAIVATPTQLTSHMQQTKLMEFTDILVGGSSFQSLMDKENHIQDVYKYPFIMLGKETMTYFYFNQFFLQHKLELNPEIEVATTDQVLPLVQHNLGLGFLPKPYAIDAIQKGDIFHIPLQEELSSRHIVLITDKRRPLNIATKELIHTLK